MQPPETTRLLKALAFSADKHRSQRRKDVEASPYINHPIDVATLLAETGGITDITTLVGAILHDTIEDTETTAEELEQHFGHEVRALVEEVTDDKTLPKAERKRRQVESAPRASVAAQQIKIADKTCNILDIIHHPPLHWSLERRVQYLNWTEEVIAGCRGSSPALEHTYDLVLRKARALLDNQSPENRS